MAASFTGYAQVGVGTTNPHTSAALDVESTTKGFLPPRMTKVQMDGITTPSQGLVVYCTDCISKGLYVNDGTKFNNASSPTPVNTIGTNDVVSATGLVWADRNLGATQVATSSTDAAAYGDLYQWGRNTDGHEIRTSTTAAGPVGSGTEGATFITATVAPSDWLSAQDDNRWHGESAAHNPCPSGYRVPSDYEWQAERNSWETKNSAGAFTSLKLPMGGRRGTNGTVSLPGTYGSYWSSTSSNTGARNLGFNTGNASMYTNVRGHGFSVRCIKD